MQPIVYEYLDYRAFLKDTIQFKKKENSKFSYRYFSMKAGFASTNFISLVVNGKRNLSASSISKLARGLKLAKNDHDFFENLVFMNQSSNHDEKNHYFKKMIALKRFSESKHLGKQNYEYFSKWYYPVIRELVAFGERRFTPGEIAKLLNPPISARQAKQAIKPLTELKLIKKNKDGRWEKCDRYLSTGPEVTSLVVTNFHKEMSKIASDAIENHPRDKRDISGMVLAINSATMKEIKERIDSFRSEIEELILDQKEADEVLYLNILAFPLSQKIIQKE